MDPSAQNFLVNLFNSNKVDDSSDQNKKFNPNSQPLLPQQPSFQGQLPLMFNLNPAFTVPQQNSNINKEMSQSILSILQKKEPEKIETSGTTSSPHPTAEGLIQKPISTQNSTLSSNTEELKKLLQINTTMDNSNKMSITSAPAVAPEEKQITNTIKSNDKPKVQSNPNTPLFGYINPFAAMNNSKEKFSGRTEKSDSDYEIVEIQDLNNDEVIMSNNQQKKESELVAEPFEVENGITPLKKEITFNLDSSLEKAQPAKEIITVSKIKRNIEKISGKEIAVNDKYICYSSKNKNNKNIRVINQESGDLRFFKGHENNVIDTVVFVSKTQNKSLLKAASIDTDNTLILWSEDNNKDLKKLLTVNGIDNGSNRFQRVLYHPSNDNIVAVSTNTNNILLFDLRKYKETVITESKALEDEVDVQDFGYESKINDFKFSSDGSVIVAGYEDGHVRFYDINSGSVIYDFTPHNSEPVTSVIFANHKDLALDLFLITASKQNNEIKLWSINDMQLVQTINLIHTDKTPEYDFNSLEYNGQHQLLVMSNVSRLSIMFSHIKGLETVNYPEPDSYEKDIVNNNEKGVDISNVEFEEIKEFKINDPIINYIIDPNVDPLFNNENENENVSLYCISTEEIFQYVICMNGNKAPSKTTIEGKKKVESENPVKPEPKEKTSSEEESKEKVTPPQNDLLYILTTAQKEANKSSSNELLKLIKEGSNSSIRSSPKPSQEPSNISTPLSSSAAHSESNIENSGANDIFQTISDLNNTNNLLKIFESNANPEPKKVASPASPATPKIRRKSSTISPIEMKTSNSDVSKDANAGETVNVSQAQLHNELKKLEANLTSKMNEMLNKQNKHYEKLLTYEKKKRIEAEIKNREFIAKTVRDDIKHHSGDAIEQALSKEIKNNVMPNLTNAINQTINQQLNKQVESAINKNLKKISDKVTQNLKESISEIVKPIVSDTVKSLINNYLATDFQKAISYAILQANESIQNEVSKTIKNEYMNNAASPSYNEIYRQINSINTQLQNIQQNITMKSAPERSNSFTIQTPTVIPAAYVNSTIATSPMKMNFRRSGSDKNIAGLRSTDFETSSVSSSYRKSTDFEHAEIDRLIKEEKFEEIFTNILKSTNEEELLYVCSKLDPNKLLINSNYLSQIVIIALIKQLSDNLSLNATWRIEWLRCSIIVLNINDEYIKGICPNILKESSEKMMNFINEVKKVQPQSSIIDDMNTLVGAILFSLNNCNK